MLKELIGLGNLQEPQSLSANKLPLDLNFESIDSARQTASNSKQLYERYQQHLPMKDILNRHQKQGVRSFLQL
jgi:hypothetical protein